MNRKEITVNTAIDAVFDVLAKVVPEKLPEIREALQNELAKRKG